MIFTLDNALPVSISLNPKSLTLNNVAVFYENRKVCENISFTVNEGDRISLSGKNGCGKKKE